MTASTSKLFQPATIGDLTLGHRVVMAPLTRFRANKDHVMGPMNQEYYEQRAGAPGTLIISEGTFISPQSGGFPNVPGIWNEAQIAGWKKIVDAVHSKGSYIYLQLWDIGAAAKPEVLEAEGNFPYTGAGDLLFDEHDMPPRPLTVDEIHERVGLYATAARNAVHKAGFDGVEVHSANGYLLDQFLQSNTNNRTDAYGGSVENRIRFPLEVVDAVIAAVGESKTALRLSPWSRFQGMRMDDPVPTYSALVTRIRDAHPALAYLHVVEPRIDGVVTRDAEEGGQNEFLRAIWAPRPFIAAGGFTRASALEAAERTGDLIAFGRSFIANPDLVYRLKEDIPLTVGNRATYYGEGLVGYTDYPFAAVEEKDVAVEVVLPEKIETSAVSDVLQAKSEVITTGSDSFSWKKLVKPLQHLLTEAPLAPSRRQATKA
ncbi:FMN-linked oxidoreductase [Artomyces pyxidatus]|uniref:FMN-linked oxidoreductase n=1 Tax=Artomyces pyxidatus TaxID=48021 RepID=A0ACB8SPI5_9AGAM|nr:FMN-linked oxidoreductase [Artomyces pyxidatus]